ncbi:hypothetical protein JXI42_12710 [bacterium]|nr:hypothetical protein [bacterium]
MKKILLVPFFLLLITSNVLSFNYNVDYLQNINTYSLLHDLRYQVYPSSLKSISLEANFVSNLHPSYINNDKHQMNYIGNLTLDLQKDTKFSDMKLLFTGVTDVFEEEHTNEINAMLFNEFPVGKFDIELGVGAQYYDRFRDGLSSKQTGYLAEGEMEYNHDNIIANLEGSIEGLSVIPKKEYSFSLVTSPELEALKSQFNFEAGRSYSDENYFVPSISEEQINNKITSDNFVTVEAVNSFFDWLEPLLIVGARYKEIDYLAEDADSARLQRLTDYSSVLTSLYSEYSISILRQWLNTKLGYVYELRESDYGDDNRDEDKRRGELLLSNLLKFKNDTLNLDWSIDLTRFDDKRDESFSGSRDIQSQLIRTGYAHAFSRFLLFRADFFWKSIHKYYIHSSLSGSNSEEITYLLTPKLIFRTANGIIVSQEFPIRATYLLYDFEKNETEDPPHRLLREGRWTTTIRGEYDRFSWEVFYSPNMKDYGRLVWKEQWVEWLSWERISHQGRLGIVWEILPGLEWNAAVIGEIKNEWEWKENEGTGNIEKQFSSKLERKEIDTGLALSPSRYATFSLNWNYRNDRYPRTDDSENYTTVSLSSSLVF